MNLAARCAGLAAFALATACLAQTPDYPSKPIRLIVPFSAGGTADILARLIGDRMTSTLRQQVIVENRPGAGGNLGAAAVANAKPDGYTLLLGTVSTHAINPNLYPKLPFDPVRSFSPITRVAIMPNLLVVNPQVPAKTVRELVDYAKANPGRLAFASAGSGTSQHLSAELFKTMAGVDLTHVPYRGNALAVTDLIGGQVQLMFDNVAVSLPQVRGGNLRALAVTSPRRSAAVPDLPTIAESGFPGYAIVSWFALLAPAGTSPDIVERLNRAAMAALNAPHVKARLMKDGIEPAPTTPSQLAAFIGDELLKWGKIVKESGARVE
jgi:tripartite-type tricarboxylate transporter receptor subunit TctC